ncbi:SAM-dependent methyltransferase [Paenibacillus polysaccharolyticus]|uniref:SAM-dependent methyltransferase n=1 Tax=Paenibacillus cucumis (ex Kampfer et al. 2016) TaxID=1776858 RepID=A0ABS7KL67_9BACL|nr:MULTISPECIES: SAM-dependent methyltransferase [Paenibacillus]MBY0204840.1 SAM-dependent methyltransferase [Paenibacillus cucumis (ex Kampfer et al. 2016)]MCP1133434.1 SAM-dependent methyltransferase [Paenibacillus polysaccharolyticus]MDP9697377.1 23S rRNA (cytidine2498-2'-O)-methyltransferase [Paenibacillus intestini]
MSTQSLSGETDFSRFICTANHGFAPYAQEELRRTFGAVKSTVLVPGEILLAGLPVAEEEVSIRLLQESPTFLRHIQPVQFQENTEDTEQSLEKLIAFILNHKELSGAKVVMQTRKTESSFWGENAASLKQMLTEKLGDLGCEWVIRDAEYVISVFAAKDMLYAGVSRPEQNLSDWSGGAIRFQKEEGQISRAKFKLLEAEQTFGIDFTSFHKALDIGAAPGGWTSFLLERGLEVTAVDPAKMDATLLASPKLTFLKKNAGDVRFREGEFDLLVCDMSWSPKLMSRLVSDLLYSLQSGGTAIVTVKLLHKKPLALIKEVIDTFERSRMQIQRSKQLFHNREEITLYMIKY